MYPRIRKIRSSEQKLLGPIQITKSQYYGISKIYQISPNKVHDEAKRCGLGTRFRASLLCIVSFLLPS